MNKPDEGSPGAGYESRIGADGTGGRRKQRYLWLTLALVLALGGAAAAAYAGQNVAQRDEEKELKRFESSAADIASTLDLAIQDQEDLVVNASGYFVANPNASTADFIKWTASVRVLERYPELQALGYLVVVPGAQLPAFVARAEAEAGAASPVAFEVFPPGQRPFYCLLRFELNLNPALAAQRGLDLCATPLGDELLSARDTGQGAYLPLATSEDFAWLLVGTPIYREGTVPATVELRRDAFVGWAGTIIDPQVPLARALEGHPDVVVSMHHHPHTPGSTVSSGTPSEGAQVATVDLGGNWTMEASTTLPPGGLFHNATALGLFGTGAALSILVAILVLVLGTGRSRALSLVEERTGELHHQALHDGLTGLPNRTLLMDRIDQLLVRNRRHGTQGAALFVDLDEFKNINDTLGHAVGDQLLVAVASRLVTTLRDADTIGRMGGDEFVILIDGGELRSGPELVAERLLGVMRQPFELAGVTMPLMINASIGIAVGDRDTGGELLRDADVALYQAKDAGKNRFEVFFPAMQTAISHRIELEFELRSALEREQFRLVYQPVYTLDDMSIVGVEALLRWDVEGRETIQPMEFIPILEQTGQIREVGRWVLREACRQMAEWHAHGTLLDISVNVSGRQLDDDAIVDHISEALRFSGLDPRRLIVEVTETALMRNVDSTARRLQAIKDLGVRIAVDDFGTGYSSLAYLRQFPVDCLKIDRSFTNAIASSPEAAALIGTLVQLGRDLGLRTLAEGVETTGQLNHLRKEHVDEAQGFLFARPLDPATLEVEILEPLRRRNAVA